jgi:arabinogalactan endo-1,4-beta-galactosidase
MILALPCMACTSSQYLMGADLSYTNEMEDCGAVYKLQGEITDPYRILRAKGANIVRLRLWHTPDWTDYSTLQDVKKSITRARAQGMQVLLAPHNSDDWADPQKQTIPHAWASYINDIPKLSEAFYRYTYDTLLELHAAGLAPDIVQVGNEINGDILRAPDTTGVPINWPRNSQLINSGIKAIRDAGRKTGADFKVLLHVAQPENAERWFKEAAAAGVTDFDYIGISYYEKWSERNLAELGTTVSAMKQEYRAEVIIVETSYPWTRQNRDEADNILGADSLTDGYEPTPAGQKRYLTDLSRIVLQNGASGVVYWEPGWLSTPCNTRWGKGSHWENATLFDFDGEALEGMDFFTSWQSN